MVNLIEIQQIKKEWKISRPIIVSKVDLETFTFEKGSFDEWLCFATWFFINISHFDKPLQTFFCYGTFNNRPFEMRHQKQLNDTLMKKGATRKVTSSWWNAGEGKLTRGYLPYQKGGTKVFVLNTKLIVIIKNNIWLYFNRSEHRAYLCCHQGRFL